MSKIRDKTGKFIKAQTNEEKFWEKVNIRNNGCWEWLAQKDKDGYGTFMLSSNKGQKRTRAHRYSWVLHFGDVPKEKFVLHKCDNPPCVNIAHLFLGTQADNLADARAKGRIPTAKHGSYSLYVKGCRCEDCRTAQREYQRQYRVGRNEERKAYQHRWRAERKLRVAMSK